MISKASIAFTPIDDVIGLPKGATDYAFGDEVDYFDVSLSAIGLAATNATLFTAGTSYSVKIGTSALKLARGMALRPPGLIGPKSIGAIEVLGKSRFMRAALRYSDEAIGLSGSIIGVMLTLGMAISSLIQSMTSRHLRRFLRQIAH